MGQLIQFPGQPPAPPEQAPAGPTVAIPVAMINDFTLHSGAIGLYAAFLSDPRGVDAAVKDTRRYHKSGEVVEYLTQLKTGGYIK